MVTAHPGGGRLVLVLPNNTQSIPQKTVPARCGLFLPQYLGHASADCLGQ